MRETANGAPPAKRRRPGHEFAAKMPVGASVFQPVPTKVVDLMTQAEAPASFGPPGARDAVESGGPPTKQARVAIGSDEAASPMSPQEVETLFADAGVRTPSFLLYPNNALQAEAVTERVG